MAVTEVELVVKNGGLKVDATSTVPIAVRTLFNAVTGQVIGRCALPCGQNVLKARNYETIAPLSSSWGRRAARGAVQSQRLC